MTTASNSQMADRGTAGKSTNKESAMMKVRSNIQGIIRANAMVLAGIIIGVMIAAASMFPGSASAESPPRPVSEGEGASFRISSSVQTTEIDDWVSLTYQPKLAFSNIVGPEVDNWISLTYQPKLALSNTTGPEVDNWVALTYQPKLVKSSTGTPEGDDWVSLTYAEKLVASKFASPFDSPEVDDLVDLSYGGKLVAGFDYPESLILNDDFSTI